MTRRTWAMTRYAMLFIGLFLFDRLTKLWAVCCLDENSIKVCKNMNLHLMWNRGVAGSFLSTSSTFGFVLLSVFILCMIAGFAFFAFVRYHNNHSIFFETLVLAGAFSNIIDRCVYGAVVDFIECFCRGWYFPTFNIADALIFIGVMGILIISYSTDNVRR